MQPNVRAGSRVPRMDRPSDLPTTTVALRLELYHRRARGGPFWSLHRRPENFTCRKRGTPIVREEQQARFADVVSDERPWEYVEAVYMPGTIDEIQTKVQARLDAGVEYMMLHTMSADVEQLELIAKHIIEPFAGVT